MAAEMGRPKDTTWRACNRELKRRKAALRAVTTTDVDFGSPPQRRYPRGSFRSKDGEPVLRAVLVDPAAPHEVLGPTWGSGEKMYPYLIYVSSLAGGGLTGLRGD